MLNFARFRIPSHFERQYMRNGERYLKSGNMMHYSVPSRVQRKKFGELWSTCYGDLEEQLYAKNRIFGRPYFDP